MQLIRKVTICMLGFVCCLFSIIGIATFNYGTYNIAEAEMNDDGQKICTIGEVPIYFDSEQVHFNSKEINASFTLLGSADVVSIDFENNGIDVLSYELVSGNNICIYLRYDYSVDNHFMCMLVNLSNGESLTARLFAIDNTSGIFISPFSLNDAYENYFNYAISIGALSQDECQSIRNKLNSCSVIEDTDVLDVNVNYNFSSIDNSLGFMPKQEEYIAPSYSVSGVSTYADKDTFVKGTLKWTDDNGVTHPLRRVQVDIFDKEPSGETHIGTVYSDNVGNFSFTFQNKDGFWDFENGGLDIFIRIFAGDANAAVKIGSGSAYYYESTLSENMATGTTKLCNYTFSMESDLGRAFQISQALLTARDYAWNMIGQIPNSVTLRYPYDTYCYYNSGARQITITGNARSNTSVPESYASWDVIMHEYGHHIEYQVGIIDSRGVKHNFTRNLADRLGNKNDGIKVAWYESWATVFGMVSQNYWRAHLTNIATVNDSNYDAYNFDSLYSVENDSTRLGEACEGSVMAVLWDLFDPANGEPNDTISLTYQQFWNVTSSNQVKTFSDFINVFYEVYPQYIDKLGKNLTYYNIATAVPVMSNYSAVSQTNPPTFTWTPQGGSSTYPNNKFRLVFYDCNGAVSLKTAYTQSCSYTLTQSEWDSVLHTYGRTYTVAVAAMQTDDYSTGEYISASTTAYTKPTPTNLTASISLSASSRYTERIVDLQPNQYIDYTITFPVSGKQLIQTFGTKDSMLYLYDANGVELTHDDDSGYERNALISYDFSQNVTYTLRVKFCIGDLSGKIRFAIIPQQSSYSSFDKIIQRYNNMNLYSGLLSNYTSALVRFNSSTSKSVTFTTDCEFDAYLFVIDPRSTEAISSNGASGYNDDSAGNMQAKITKQLDANVPYLVILTAYNPSTQSGYFEINFS